MEPENDEGNIEYKLKLMDLSSSRIERIATQMRYRCTEGGSECIYILGVEDNGTMIGMTEIEYNLTIECIKQAAIKNSYTVSQLSKTQVEGDNDRFVYEVLIRENNEQKYIDIKIAIAGSVDAGKSSMLGVLTTGKKDNGRGSARLSVFNFPHEISSGRTSSVGHQIVGYNKNGENVSYNTDRTLSWPEIVKQSSKIVSFYDLAGHEKYLKTTIFGLASSSPDLCFIMVGANRGVIKMTREHIFLCLTLQIPFCIIITKIDMVKDNKKILKETVDSITKILKSPGVRKVPLKIKSNEDVIRSAVHLHTKTIVPIFPVSNTTMEGIERINYFLNLVPKKPSEKTIKDVEMYIDIGWTIPGVGTVIGGHLRSGNIKIGDKLWYGPNNNKYTQVTVKSIHCKKVAMQEINFGVYACLGVKGITKSDVKKGNVVISNTAQQILCGSIKVEIEVLQAHSTTIKVGYHPTMHALTVRTPCRLDKIENKISSRDSEFDNDDILRTSDKAIITLTLTNGKKFIKPNTNILLCEGRTKVIGRIIETY